MRRRYARWDVDVPRSDENIDEPRDEERIPLGVRLSRVRQADRREGSGLHLDARDQIDLFWADYDPQMDDGTQVEPPAAHVE